MFRINIILMLSTIIPDLDCCSSFKIFNRKSIHLYPAAGIELSIHKSMQFQQNIPHSHKCHQLLQQQQTAFSSTQQQPLLITSFSSSSSGSSNSSSSSPVKHEDDEDGTGNAAINFWHKYFKTKNKNFDKEVLEDRAKLNKSTRTEPEQSLLDQESSINLDRAKFNKSTRTEPEQSLQDQESSINLDDRNADQSVDDPHRLHLVLPTEISTVQPESTTEDDQHLLDQKEDIEFKIFSEIVSLECVDILKLEFCLNGGRCFLYPILNHSLSSCECAEGFVGERCEAKSYEFIPRIRPRFVLAKTRGGPLVYGLALVDILFLLFLFCKNFNRD